MRETLREYTNTWNLLRKQAVCFLPLNVWDHLIGNGHCVAQKHHLP